MPGIDEVGESMEFESRLKLLLYRKPLSILFELRIVLGTWLHVLLPSCEGLIDGVFSDRNTLPLRSLLLKILQVDTIVIVRRLGKGPWIDKSTTKLSGLVMDEGMCTLDSLNRGHRKRVSIKFEVVERLGW